MRRRLPGSGLACSGLRLAAAPVLRFVPDCGGRSSLELVELHAELRGFVDSVHVASDLLLKEVVGVSLSKQVEKSPALRDKIREDTL